MIKSNVFIEQDELDYLLLIKGIEKKRELELLVKKYRQRKGSYIDLSNGEFCRENNEG